MENTETSIFSMIVSDLSKEAIIDIALQNFLKDGIQSFTIQQLTRFTRVSSKTIYKLFVDKTGLLKACLSVHYSRLFAELNELATDAADPIEAFLKVIYRVVALEFKVNPLFYQELNRYYPELQDEVAVHLKNEIISMSGFVKQGKESGLFLRDINEEVFWIAFQQLYKGITRDRVYEAFDLSGPELVKHTLIVYIRGICTIQGLQKLETYEQQYL